MLSKISTLSLAAAFAVSFAGVAQASLYTHNCTATSQNKTVEYKLGTAFDVLCVDNDNDVGGNGFFANDPSPTVFGLSGWKLYDKIDAVDDDALNGDFTFGTSTMAAYDQSNMGKITINNNDLLSFDSVLVVLKEAKSFAAFLVDKTHTSWDWMTDGTISHASIWYNGDDDGNNNNPPVPLPAAGWLLIGGLGGLAALRRRKKA